MKFGQQLKEEELAAPPLFAGSFMRYKHLKKYLKYRGLTIAISQRPEDVLTTDKDFKRMLLEQLQCVEKKFEAEAGTIISQFDARSRRSSCLGSLVRSFGASKRSGAGGYRASKATVALAERAHWCRKYAQLNATALRKIAKKHDKLIGGTFGQQFVQALYRGELPVHKFFCAPLLSELAAVEELSRPAADDPAPLAASLAPPLASTPPDLAGQDQASLITEAREGEMFDMELEDPSVHSTIGRGAPVEGQDMEIDPDMQCSICLDLLYKPVALECGHTFCSRCAVAVAVGHSRGLGDAHWLIRNVAAYCDAGCPTCRSTVHGKDEESVFWEIKLLPRLEELIKKRYPKEWERRRQEDKEAQAVLKANDGIKLNYWSVKAAHQQAAEGRAASLH